MENNIVIVEDDSVDRAIEKVARKLDKQYSLKKKDTSKLKLKRTPAQKVFNIIFNIISSFLLIICALMCFSFVNSKISNTPPSFLGYNIMRVSSGSMKASGFEVGDRIAIKRVDTDTLKVGDDIAFYNYSKVSNSFAYSDCHIVPEEEIGARKYTNSLSAFVGVQSKEIVEAAKAKATLTFHKVIKIMEDKDGIRWFQTQGTSNNVPDPYVKESMVVGVHTTGGFANMATGVAGLLTNSSTFLIIIILIPVGLIAYSFMKDYARNLKIASIENEILKGKRKLNDPFCVENKIGTNLSEKEKYKVLAQASDEEKIEYINLLWRGKKPENIQKHYYRKRLKLREYEEKFKLHNECEKMRAEGEDMNEIVKYYNKEVQKIEARQEKTNKRLKKLKEQYKNDKKVA